MLIYKARANSRRLGLKSLGMRGGKYRYEHRLARLHDDDFSDGGLGDGGHGEGFTDLVGFSWI